MPISLEYSENFRANVSRKEAIFPIHPFSLCYHQIAVVLLYRIYTAVFKAVCQFIAESTSVSINLWNIRRVGRGLHAHARFERTVTPVSYTHLDVYKRQSAVRPHSQPRPLYRDGPQGTSRTYFYKNPRAVR